MDFRTVERSYTCRVALNIWKNYQTPGMVLLKLVVVTIFNIYIFDIYIIYIYMTKNYLAEWNATCVECFFYKVQLSPKQSWSVVRSSKLKEGTLSWGK